MGRKKADKVHSRIVRVSDEFFAALSAQRKAETPAVGEGPNNGMLLDRMWEAAGGIPTQQPAPWGLLNKLPLRQTSLIQQCADLLTDHPAFEGYLLAQVKSFRQISAEFGDAKLKKEEPRGQQKRTGTRGQI